MDGNIKLPKFAVFFYPLVPFPLGSIVTRDEVSLRIWASTGRGFELSAKYGVYCGNLIVAQIPP
jgi:hypothetical protein